MNFIEHFENELNQLRKQGLYKTERVISSPQSAHITSEYKQVINLCANNYLGLANHPALVAKAQEALTTHGFGMSSVRFICGTQDIHKDLEKQLSAFLQTEDATLYSSCYDANGGLFEALLGPDDAVISDALNHASIIDGIRLCKAKRFRYANNNMRELEERLLETKNCRFRLIATDGVFSMDGVIAHLQNICDLAERYNALVMVDDSHAVGFMGANGRGTPEHCGVLNRIDILTGTLGKALGGASGGYVAGRKPIIEWLRQRSRPYLFSNSLAPVIVKTSLSVLEMLQTQNSLREKLHSNTRYFRRGLQDLKFQLIPGEHPIIPVMLGDAALATQMADTLLQEGVYVIGFSYPVVPQGLARIRTQMSAAHSQQDLDFALAAFGKVGRQLNLLG